MNLETVLKCAQLTAAKQLSALGVVDQDVQDLINELTPAVEIVVEATPETVVQEVPVAPLVGVSAEVADGE